MVNKINWYEFLNNLKDITEYYYLLDVEFVSIEKEKLAVYKFYPLKEISVDADILENVSVDKEAYFILNIVELKPIQKLFTSLDDAIHYIYQGGE